ncbi:VWA domain-containing protein [Rhodobacterales bacterium HKCCE2091]|nr:VWA domain-containing protein [Rhodobacterales bacterium HKCCE2091]
MVRILAALFALILAALQVSAQDAGGRPDTILVLDASGSMWGQIDGVNKIVIARDVLGRVLGEVPEDMNLGLMAYGHNRRGDCSDIEMLIQPGPGTRLDIVEAINGINPRGRTPMSDAVVAAAEALHFTENAATVILVSDGIETCAADPCAIARTLEETGVDFTAHVIGFDVAGEPEARAQMQCLAETTGGEFLTADNAEELTAALTRVAAAPPPPPPATITFAARVEDGTAPVSPLFWSVRDGAGNVVFDPVTAPGFEVALPAGDYRAEVLRVNQGTAHGADFTVVAGEDQTVVVTLPALPPPLTEVTFEARIGGPEGPVITDPVIWELSPADEAVNGEDMANPLVATLPRAAFTVTATWTAQEITESVQFVVTADPRTIAVVFPEPLPAATITAPATAIAGSTIEVGWTGPDERNDYIGIGPVGAEGSDRWINSSYTRDGSPLQLVMPPDPGSYEITYFRAEGRIPLGSARIEVTPVEASLTIPAEAEAGSVIDVGWTGPDYRNDYIGIGPAGAEDGDRWQNQNYTRNGNPLRLQVPPEPGQYEVIYVLAQDRVVLASATLTVTETRAVITAPAEAVAGSTIEVGWTGPAARNDYIGIGRTGAEGGDRYEEFTYVRDGNPLSLRTPTDPGAYEITYFSEQGRTPLGSAPITLTEVGATITAPQTAEAGATIEIGWTGPDFHNDYIGIGETGAEGGARWENFTYTREGDPLSLLVPVRPGSYEISYFLQSDRTVLTTVPIEVLPVAASLTAPAEAIAGSTIEIGWTGPDYRDDFIGIGRSHAQGGDRWENFTYTREGSPLDLLVPSRSGTYTITYFTQQDRVALATHEITVSDVEATITAPAEAVAGSTIELGWTGPDYRDDYIGIGVSGADGGDRWENFTYTREGNPLSLLVPVRPGNYEISYFTNQDRRELVTVPLTVTEVTATLTAPAQAIAGERLEIGWTGPDYRDDYIGIGEAGAEGGDRWENFTYTRDGAPLRLLLPPRAGDYEISYFTSQDRRELVTVPITLTMPEASLTAPDTAPAGSTLEIGWTGPNYPNDLIAIAPADAEGGHQWRRSVFTDRGNPARIDLPEDPGAYVIRYFIDQDRTVLASRPITLE